MAVTDDLVENPVNINISSDNIFHLSKIAKEVANKHGFNVADIKSGKHRTNPLTAARNEYFYRCLAETSRKHTEIANFLEMDHTSVAYGAARYALHKKLPFPRGAEWASRKVRVIRTYPKTKEQRGGDYKPHIATLPRPKHFKPVKLLERTPDPEREDERVRLSAKCGSKALLELLCEFHGG